MSKRRFSYSLIVLLVVLFGCNNSEKLKSELATPAPTSDLESFIDPGIKGEERAFMLEILAALPEGAREDVVHFTEDGQVYTNRVANKGQVTIIHIDEATGGWIDQNGSTYPLALPSQNSNSVVEKPIVEPPVFTIEPLTAVNPRCGLGVYGSPNYGVPDGTGIEFRMHTKPGGSSSTVPKLIGSSVKVTVPSKASGNLLVDDPTGSRDSAGIFHPFNCTHDVQQDNPNTLAVEPYGETPYVYLGGWGGVSASSRVDAGLQFNCPFDQTGSFSDYTLSLFFLKENGGAVNDILGNRFASGQQLDLRFSLGPVYHTVNGVLQLSYLFSITATGWNSARTVIQTKTITTSNNGWSIGGYDNILSLSASVAQTPNAGAGNYYVSQSTQKSKFKGVIFSNLKVYSFASEAPPPPGTPPQQTSLNWNGYSLSDPLTGANGICRVPTTYTGTGAHPIQVITSSPYSSSTASSAGIRVDLTVK